MWCDGYGMLLVIVIFIYTCILYFSVVKRYFGQSISTNLKQFKKRVAVTFTEKRLISNKSYPWQIIIIHLKLF